MKYTVKDLVNLRLLILFYLQTFLKSKFLNSIIDMQLQEYLKKLLYQ